MKFLFLKGVFPTGKDRRGFTLAEMAIVLAVIAILAAVVMVIARAYLKSSKVSAAVEQLRIITTAVTSYEAKYNKHPCKTACNSTNGWADLNEWLPSDPSADWSAQCTNGGNFSITYVAGADLTDIQTEFQKQCSSVTVDNTAKTVTCVYTTSAYCP